MMFALIDGHADAADWLWLIAAVIFLIAAVIAWDRTKELATAFVPLGLALATVGWLIL